MMAELKAQIGQKLPFRTNRHEWNKCEFLRFFEPKKIAGSMIDGKVRKPRPSTEPVAADAPPKRGTLVASDRFHRSTLPLFVVTARIPTIMANSSDTVPRGRKLPLWAITF